jgi:PAS domain S-box-containing protein
MPGPLRVLLVGEGKTAFAGLREELRRAGYQAEFARVRSAAGMETALAQGDWQLIFAGAGPAGFGAREALALLAARGVDVPLILVAGAADEERAAALMREGARDYVVKERPGRLGPLIERELRDAAERRARRAAEAALRDEERSRLLCQEQAAQARLAFLAEAGVHLAQPLDDLGRVESLARLAVPQLADRCIIYLVPGEGEEPRRPPLPLIVVAQDPAKEALVREMLRRYPADPGRPAGLPRVLRTGEPELVPEVTGDVLAGRARDAEHLRMLHELEPRSQMTVPLLARGRTLGAITFVMAESGRRYGPEDLVLAEELARRAALMADGARLYQEAEAAKRRFEELVEGLDAIVGEMDAATERFTFVSRRAEATLGYPVGQWLAGPGFLPGIIHPEDREPMVSTRMAAIAAGQDHALEYRVVAADGRTVWLRDLVRVNCDAEGRPQQVRLVMVDITAQKEAEVAGERLVASLKEAEQQLRRVVAGARCLLWDARVEERGDEYWWDLRISDEAAAQRVLPLAVPPGQTYFDAWYASKLPEDVTRMHATAAAALRAGSPSYHQEFRCRNRDGETRWLREEVQIEAQEPGRWYLVGVCTDITERKQLEEQLLQSQKMEAVGRLAGGVAHDFNNLLSVILGYSELLLMGLAKQNAQRLPLEEIHKAADRAASLTRQMLAFSRKQMLQPRVFDLNEVVTNMHRMLRRIIPEDIEVATVLDLDLGRVEADPGQIEQVIMNLAVNARDALPPGGQLRIETSRVTLNGNLAGAAGEVPPGDYVVLSVADTGSGIPPEIREHIFEPFFTTKEIGKGTGLGLATVFGIVKQSGGEIEVESEVGRGTTFRIYLPRVPEPPPEA